MDALKGMRVVDFSKVLAGPLCTQYLADMGAEVIKVEPPRGDDTRHWPPFHDGTGTVFLSANRSKQSIVLDLKSPLGNEAAQRLIDTADIVVESYGPGVARRLGIDYETVARRRPNIVYCSISGFGSQGPLRSGKGYDVVLQAFSGMMSITGESGGATVRSPISPIDQATGMHATIGILAGVAKRFQTGEGTHVEAALFDTSLAFMAYVMHSYWARGTEPERWGSAHESLCPYQVFETKDRPLLLGVANDSLWRAFCDEVEAPELADDPRYRTNADRVRHREEVLQQVSARIVKAGCDEWMDRFSRAGIPCAPVLSVGEAISHPHTQASGMIQRLDPQHDCDLNFVSQPLRFDGNRSTPLSPPPALGSHTRQVLASLGYSEDEIGRFVTPSSTAVDGVI